MPVTIITGDGAPPAIVSIAAALQQLSDDSDFRPLLRRLGAGEQVPVTLTGGTPAVMSLTRHAARAPLPLPTPYRRHGRGLLPTTRFHALAGLQLELEVEIRCSAADRASARRLIEQTVCGLLDPAEADLHAEFDEPALRRFFERIRAAVDSGNPALLGARDVFVRDLDVVRLLGYAP